MSFASAFALSILLATPPQNTSTEEILKQSSAIVEKLTTRSEKSAACLALAQAQNKLGKKKDALKTLDAGWLAFTKGSDKGLSEGDAFDTFTLIDEGDFATLPVAYGVEFLVAGSLEKAKVAADSLGDSDLGRAFRHGLGMQIRDRYPDAFETLAFTDSERAEHANIRQKLFGRVEELKTETDVAKRAFELWQLSAELNRYGAKRKETDPILKSAIDLAPEIREIPYRVMFLAQVALTLKENSQAVKGREMLDEAIKLDKTLTDNSKDVLNAHFSIEQSKRAFGLPHNMQGISRAIDDANGVIPTMTVPGPGFGPQNTPYTYMETARQYLAKGDRANAKAALAKVKYSSDTNGSLRVLVAEMQLEAGDKVAAKSNLTKGSQLFVASLRAEDSVQSESISMLDKIAIAQIRCNDRPGAVLTITKGFQKMSQGPVSKKIMHMGDGGTRMVSHDRVSPILHKGAISLAKIGDLEGAAKMARSIPNSAHRAIALAGSVRDFVRNTVVSMQ